MKEVKSTVVKDQVQEGLYKDDWWSVHDLPLMKRIFRSLDDVPMPESGHYYEELHAKIMAMVESDCDEQPANEEHASAGTHSVTG